MNHESTFIYESGWAAGVHVRLRKTTFGRRLELLRKVGDLYKRAAAQQAGTSEAEQLSAEYDKFSADRILLEWAIQSVSGLRIDGQTATPELLIDSGPEELVEELLGIVQKQLGLTDAEIKN